MQGKHVEGFETVSGLTRRCEELARLVGGERVDFRFCGFRGPYGAALRGMRASLTASPRAFWRVTWM